MPRSGVITAAEQVAATPEEVASAERELAEANPAQQTLKPAGFWDGPVDGAGGRTS